MRPGIVPTVDFAFKWLYGRERNTPILRHLLQAVLKPRLSPEELQLLNPFSEQDALDDKLSIVDIKARDQHGRQFHVEIQVVPERAFRGRILYYWAALHQQQLHAGDPYLNLRPTISVCFTDFVLFPGVPDYHLVFELRNQTRGLVFADDLLLVSLELPKFTRTAEQLSDPLEVWLYFLKHAAELDNDYLPTALDTPEIRRAMEELTVLSQSDLERERYLARVKFQRDELSRLVSAREDGLEQGRQEGLEQGRQEGLEKGQLIGVIQTYQRMLKQPVTPAEQLLDLAPANLKRLVQQLEQQLSF
jgi:predicted transposase/invertase (TIGR01784 family)